MFPSSSNEGTRRGSAGAAAAATINGSATTITIDGGGGTGNGRNRHVVRNLVLVVLAALGILSLLVLDTRVLPGIECVTSSVASASSSGDDANGATVQRSSKRASSSSSSDSIGRAVVERAYREYGFADLVEACPQIAKNPRITSGNNVTTIPRRGEQQQQQQPNRSNPKDYMWEFQECVNEQFWKPSIRSKVAGVKLKGERAKVLASVPENATTNRWPWWFQTLVRDTAMDDPPHAFWHYMSFGTAHRNMELCVVEKIGTKHWRRFHCLAQNRTPTARGCFSAVSDGQTGADTTATAASKRSELAVILRDPLDRFLSGAFLHSLVRRRCVGLFLLSASG